MKTFVIFSLLILGTAFAQDTNTAGCASKCVSCSASTGCTRCLNMALKATTADASKKECTGTAITNCQLHEGTTCEVCVQGKIRYNVGAECKDPPATGLATITSDCWNAQSTLTTGAIVDASTSCKACAGDKMPDTTAANGPVCITNPNPVAGTACAAHKAAYRCALCKDNKIITVGGTATTLDTCTDPSANQIGCVDTTCDYCNHSTSYYMTNAVAPKCTKLTSTTTTVKFSAVISVAVLTLAMMFNF